jgi:hypothetical protein
MLSTVDEHNFGVNVRSNKQKYHECLSRQDIVWNGIDLIVNQRKLHSEFKTVRCENHAYINCSAFSLYPSDITLMNCSIVENETEQNIEQPSSVSWFHMLKTLACHNRFCLPDQVKRTLSLEMEEFYLTGCCDEKRYRYLRVCLLISFKACVERVENLCMMHMIVHGMKSLSNNDMSIVLKLFDFREITNHVIDHGSFPPTLFDVL